MAAARKAAMSLMAEMDSDDDTPPPAKPQEEAKPAGDVEAATAKLGAMSTKATEEKAGKEEKQEPSGGGGFYGGGGGGGGKKKSRQAKRKEGKTDEEKRRREEAEASMKDFVDPKIGENAEISTALSKHKLVIKEVKADGHCLYRAVADQCRQNLSALSDALAQEVSGWPEGTEYMKLRRKTGQALRANRDDFEPFCDTEGLSGSDLYCAYAERVEDSAEWGGDLELQALARALTANIHVTSAAMAEQVFSPPGGAQAALHVTFHKHAYGLGEHYNSVEPAP